MGDARFYCVLICKCCCDCRVSMRELEEAWLLQKEVRPWSAKAVSFCKVAATALMLLSDYVSIKFSEESSLVSD